jgi:hypothetical protein
MARSEKHDGDSRGMILDPTRIAKRTKLILAGMYLSRFDAAGIEKLGFRNFAEAYNVIGFALGSQPASIKNYRDEFDPLFPNPRKGWHKRQIREYCLKVYEEYRGLDFEFFTGLIKSFVGYDENAWSEIEEKGRRSQGPSVFANRLITGLAAEQYFESVHSGLPEFNGFDLENTTRLGCGYDFKLYKPQREDFLAVEVKGLREATGSLSLTPKEYEIAAAMRSRFCLFVVKNFQKSPFHEIHIDPLSSGLEFTRSERVLIQVSWQTRV